MDMFRVEILVALTPALLAMMLCIVGNWISLASLFEVHVARPYREFLSSAEHVEMLIGAAVNLAFVGSAAGAIVGLSENSHESVLFGLAIGLASLLAAGRLSSLLAEINKDDTASRHRKNAGAVRSIVRSELATAAARAAKLRHLDRAHHNRCACAKCRLKNQRRARRIWRKP